MHELDVVLYYFNEVLEFDIVLYFFLNYILLKFDVVLY